jgi:hypothetical protein
MPEITLFIHDQGPLTKRIELDANGQVMKTTAARMCSGTARRVQLAGVRELAEFIGKAASNEAHAHGSLRSDLPPEVRVTTKRKLNGGGAAALISRSKEFVVYDDDRDGFVLIDFDETDMPAAVRERISRAGGVWPALCEVMPELKMAARVSRLSTSAGIYRWDTNENLGTSSNAHIYLQVKRVSDAVRFLKALHERCWLAGLGWFMVGRSGQLLERSVIDRSVGNPERLIFEGPPQIIRPLMQSAAARKPTVVEGEVLDTVQACPPLTVLEKSRMAEIRAKATQPLVNAAAKARAGFLSNRTEELAQRKGISRQAAQETIRRMNQGILRPDVLLEFDDPELAGTTVADILADPEKYAGETLADPLEGVGYGPCKAMVMVRYDGTPWIHSFAHGRTVYELRHDATAVRAAIDNARQAEKENAFLAVMRNADITKTEEEMVVGLVHQHTGTNVRAIKATLKESRHEAEREREATQYQKMLAERNDPRPMLEVPSLDAPFLPVMETTNSVISICPDEIPQPRDLGGRRRDAPPRSRHHTRFHHCKRRGLIMTALPAPRQWVIHKMTEPEVAEMIERHIDWVDKKGRSVQLPAKFVRHYMNRNDGALPTISAISTLPLVLADGHLLAPDGLDRLRGIAFIIEPELRKLLPERKDCTPAAIATAMRFLTDEWLADVAADYTGKCIIIAAALTIERSLMDSRPAFFVTAGRRGSGKTTTLQMLIEAVMGIAPAAFAWATGEEERRKALLSYLMTGIAYILWDSIPRGTQIACPHIEKSCTMAYYADRKLGVSEMVMTAAASIHLFTGNNIGPKGDLASRSLIVRLDVDRLDPENRSFRHPDPIGWTRANRAEILQAFYTVLLGNPTLDMPRDAPMKTRFKMWWRLVGSAVEHAAQCVGRELDFGKLFVEQESTEDEDATSLAEFLHSISQIFVGQFSAGDLSAYLNQTNGDHAQTVREFMFPSLGANEKVTPKGVGKWLKAHIAEPAKHREETLVLRATMDKHDKVYMFRVVELKAT